METPFKQAARDPWTDLERGFTTKFWVSPTGKLIDASNGHGVLARQKYPNEDGAWKWSDEVDLAIDSLIKAGWIRVSLEKQTIWLDGKVKAQQNEVIKDIEEITGKVRQIDKRLGQRVYGYWIDSGGKMIPVSIIQGHANVAIKILGSDIVQDFFEEDNLAIYNQMFDRGYVRVVTQNRVYVEGDPNFTQLRVLKRYAEDQELPLVNDKGRTLYDPRRELVTARAKLPKFSFPLKIYRGLYLPEGESQLNKNDLGIFWTWDPELAQHYTDNVIKYPHSKVEPGALRKGKGVYVVVAKVNKEDINWSWTLEANQEGPEKEIILNDNAKPTFIGIFPVQLEGEAHYGIARIAKRSFDSIRLGEQDLRVVSLNTPAEQAQGFQYVKEIPKDYGLLFPNAGDHYFHMLNCHQAILMVSLDKEHKVVGKEIRQPNTRGKVVAKGQGRHILEIHPLYDPWVEVGSRLGEIRKARKRTAVIGDAWMEPNGKVYEIGGRQHDEWAAEYLEETYEDSGNHALALINDGWLRIVRSHSSEIFFSGTANRKQLKELKDLAIEEQRTLIDDSDKVIIDPTKREASRIPIILYHKTDYRNKGSILEKGILPVKDYILVDTVADNLGVNLYSKGSDIPNPSPGVIFTVNTSSLDLAKLRHRGSGWWRYEGIISPSAIKESL